MKWLKNSSATEAMDLPGMLDFKRIASYPIIKRARRFLHEL
ncbi:MAG: hypothetical protein ACYT04_56755 [Nostoc sp.]